MIEMFITREWHPKLLISLVNFVSIEHVSRGNDSSDDLCFGEMMCLVFTSHVISHPAGENSYSGGVVFPQ